MRKDRKQDHKEKNAQQTILCIPVVRNLLVQHVIQFITARNRVGAESVNRAGKNCGIVLRILIRHTAANK